MNTGKKVFPIKHQEAKIRLLEGQVELLKKLDRIERMLVNKRESPDISEMFQLIHETILKYDFKNMVTYFCEMLGISCSGYYNYMASTETRQELEEKDIQAKDMILKAYQNHGYEKGSHSVKMTLEQKSNVIFNRNRIQRIMRKYGIVCPIRRADPYQLMMKATKEHTMVPNLLNRQFKQFIPGKVLLHYISSIWLIKNSLFIYG